MACLLVNGWLLLQDGRESVRKGDLVRVYLREHLPEIHRSGEVLLSEQAAPLAVKDAVFNSG
jgi:hypothetical protein